MPIAAHSASDLNIKLEALLGIIIIVACIVYVFHDLLWAALKTVRAALFRAAGLIRYTRSKVRRKANGE